MKPVVALLAIALLAGTATQAMADSHNIAPITAETSSASYQEGDVITVSGAIKELDADFLCGVTIQIVDPNNNIVRVAQANPVSSGEYQFTFPAGGPNWKVSGEYTINIRCNADVTSATFEYTVPEPVTCDVGQELVGNDCVMITCDVGQELVGNDCVMITCDVGQELVGNDCVMITCDVGQELVGNDCVMITCDPGYELVGNDCQPIPEICGEGTELVDGQCQIIRPPPPEPMTCEDGYELVDGQCQLIPPICGEGTELVDGQCQAIAQPGGGCLIATAAYGTELAPQVQYLREIRDNTLLSTSSGSSFMETFNGIYYAVSPQIADLERENPAFREMVRIAITPMLSSLTLMGMAEDGSEASVLGMGMLVIALNAGMYIGAPALLGFKAYGKVRAMRRN